MKYFFSLRPRVLGKPSFDRIFLIEYLRLSHPLFFLLRKTNIFLCFRIITESLVTAISNPVIEEWYKIFCLWQKIPHPLVSCQQCILTWGPKKFYKNCSASSLAPWDLFSLAQPWRSCITISPFCSLVDGRIPPWTGRPWPELYTGPAFHAANDGWLHCQH